MENVNAYEVVICVGQQHLEISVITIKSIYDSLLPIKVNIITSRKNWSIYIPLQKIYPSLFLYDEDLVIDGLKKRNLDNYFEKRIEDNSRVGWYFQQFLKLSAASFIKSPYYLIWDADTILLKPIDFFYKQSRVLVQPSDEYHEPYFRTIERVLSIPKQTNSSFISEHFMIAKTGVECLLSKITPNSNGNSWIFNILDSIDTADLPFSGFSEYETYGNFMLFHNGQNIKIRTNASNEHILSSRYGSKLFGPIPDDMDLALLQDLGYHYVTFEIWDKGAKQQILKNKKYASCFVKTKSNTFINALGIGKVIRKLIIKKISKQLSIL